MTLDEIGRRNGADSSSLVHGYLDAYEARLSPRHEAIRRFLLVSTGALATIQTWAEYLDQTEITVAVPSEIDQSTLPHNVTAVVVAPNNVQALGQVARACRPDLAIDDGTHVWGHQIATFQAVFPEVASGGQYFVEDLQTNFGHYRDVYSHGADVSFFEWVMVLASGYVAGVTAPDSSDAFESYFRGSVQSVEFMRQVALVTKAHAAAPVLTEDLAVDVARSAQLVHAAAYERVPGTLVGASPIVEREFETLAHSDGSRATAPDSATVLVHDAVVSGRAVTWLEYEGLILEQQLNCVRNIGRSGNFVRLGAPGIGAKWSMESLPHAESAPSAPPGHRYVLLKSAWDRNYGHWLVDSLARLATVDDALDGFEPIFVVNTQKGAMRAVVRDSLEMAGYGAAQVLEHDGRPLKFEEVLVPADLSYHPTLKHPLALQLLERVADQVEAGPDERIYISRNDYGRRGLLNEQEILPMFENAGFRRVEPETLTFREQVALFKGANVVAGNLGAGFTSLAFSPERVTALVLTTPVMRHDFFYDIVCHKHGSYLAAQGKATDSGLEMGTDFTVDPEVVASLLAQLNDSERHGS